MISELLEGNRSYRRFEEGVKIPDCLFADMANALRFSASAANLQKIRLLFVKDEEECLRVFKTLRFAGYLKEWNGPREGERPAAYAVLLSEDEPGNMQWIDVGIAAQSMLLVAREGGFGGCMLASFTEEALMKALSLDGYHPLLVIALGKPSETVRISNVENGDIKYYRNEGDEHIVPKRPLDEILIRPIS